MIDCVLRGYLKGDLEAMFRLDEVCFASQFRFTREMMRHSAEASVARVVVAEKDKELIGFCIAHVEQENMGYVVTLDVDPSYRRNGVARLLMKCLEAECRDAGCLSMWLHAYTENSAAIRFYERMGYRFLHIDEDFYGEGSDARVYIRALNPA